MKDKIKYDMLLKYIFFAADVILLNAALLLGAYAGDSTAQDTAYLLIYSNLAWLFLGLVSGVYQITRQWAPARILRHQIAFLLIHLLAVLALIHFLNKHYSPLQLAVSYLVFALLYLGYKATFYYFRNAIRKSKRLRNFIIVGRNDLAYTLRKYYIQHPELGYCFKGFRDIDSIESIGQFCVENEVKEIQCCAPLTEKQAQELVAFGLNRLVKVKIVYENPATAEVSKSKLIDIQPAREQATPPRHSPRAGTSLSAPRPTDKQNSEKKFRLVAHGDFICFGFVVVHSLSRIDYYTRLQRANGFLL